MARTHFLAALAVTGLLGSTLFGCSGSKRSSYVTTTAAPATSGTTGGGGVSSGTTPGATAGGLPQAPASQGTAVDEFNRELQLVWDNMRPLILTQLETMAQQQLQGQQYTSSAVDVEIRAVRFGSAMDMNVAPGLSTLRNDKLVLRAPVTGEWTLVLEADARVTVKVGSFSPAINLPLKLILEDLTLEVEADFDTTTDPTRPVLTRIGQPQVNFTMRLDSSNPIVGSLTGVLTQPANWLAQQAVTLGLASVVPTMQAMQGLPGPIPGVGAAHLQDNGVQTPFDEVLANVELKIRRDNMPHGTNLTAQMDTPQTDSWLDAYKNGGPGNLGTVVNYHSGGDSAIFTGMYLAAEAFRFAATGDSLAMDSIGHTLKGIGGLLEANGGTGLLARVAAPENSIVGRNIARRGVFRQNTYMGETWVCRQGTKGITRDQYSGVMFGLSIAYELVPAVRPDCELRLRQMLDYLIRNDWIITEDRPTWNGTNGSRGPTFWAGIAYQRLAYLLMGHRMDPAAYAAELAKAGPLSETAWIGAWTSTFGFDHYYKFNLSHLGYYNYFRLETDQTRWQHMHRAYAMIERYVGHHHNPHFDLIESSIDPHTTVDNFPASKQALRDFLDRNHREIAPPVVDLSGVTFVPYTSSSYSNTSGGGFSVGATTQQIPSEPLDIVLRKPSGNFLWQRDPFSPATPNHGNAGAEKHGLDLVLPYWMGKYYGAW